MEDLKKVKYKYQCILTTFGGGPFLAPVEICKKMKIIHEDNGDDGKTRHELKHDQTARIIFICKSSTH